MKKSYFKVILGVISTLSILVSNSSQASFDWTYTQATNGGSTYCGASCTQDYTDNGITIYAEATGWTTPDDVISSNLQARNLRVWSGLGVENPGENSPEHATDANGRKESILFSFTEQVALTSITMGWISNDADFSLLRYTGTADPRLTPDALDDNNYSDLLTVNGGSWELVDNYMYSGGAYAPGSGMTADVNPVDPNTDERKTSSYWLVAALNSAYWSGGTKFLGNDYFKLKSLAATYTPPGTPPQGVPEPSTLALMSVSFLAFGFTQRRRRKEFLC